MMTGGVVDGEHEHAEDQTNRCCDGQSPAFCGTSGGFEGGVVNGLQRRLVEVAVFVRVRINEEALGAAFH